MGYIFLNKLTWSQGGSVATLLAIPSYQQQQQTFDSGINP